MYLFTLIEVWNHIMIFYCSNIDIYIPRSSKGAKFQSPGLFLVVERAQILDPTGGFRYITYMICPTTSITGRN